MYCNPIIRKAVEKICRTVLPCIFAWMGLQGTGCTPLSETEKEYLEQRDADRELEEKFSAGLGESDRQQEVLEKVKNHPVEGVGTSEEWVKAQLDEETEQIAFQNWIVRQKSDQVFEVRFLYTTLNDTFQITKKGFSWSVNKLLDFKVTGPETLDSAELEPSFRRKDANQSVRSRTEERWSLE